MAPDPGQKTSKQHTTVGTCPTCGTALDHDEVIVGDGWIEAFCCTCSRYIRKKVAY